MNYSDFAQQAEPIENWHLVKDGLPKKGTEVEVLHFGGDPKREYFNTGIVDRYGIRPYCVGVLKGKRSTVTHWRSII